MPRLNPFAQGALKLAQHWRAGIDGHVIALAWSAPLGLIAAASVDGPIALFDAQTGELRRTLDGHGFGTTCATWSADGMHLATAGQDGQVKIWDTDTGQAKVTMPGGAAWVERIAWCPLGAAACGLEPARNIASAKPQAAEGNLLASAAGKKLRLWNVDGSLLREYADHPSTLADIQWQPPQTAGQMNAVLASTAYGKLFFWSPGQQDPVREFSWQGSMLALAWSPDGKYIAAGAQDSSVHFWLLATGEDLQMTGYPTKVRELSWDCTSRYLATGGGPIPCVWDTSGKGPAGTEPLQFEAHQDNVSCLAFQPRGTLLASGGEDGLVALWQPGKQQGPLALARHPSPVATLLWSADSQCLLVGTAEGDVVLYAIR
jgi:WD40 repeat protein